MLYLLKIKKQQEKKLISLIKKSSLTLNDFKDYIEEYSSFKFDYTFEMDPEKILSFEEKNGDMIWKTIITIIAINSLPNEEFLTISKTMEEKNEGISYIVNNVFARVDYDYDNSNKAAMYCLEEVFNNIRLEELDKENKKIN